MNSKQKITVILETVKEQTNLLDSKDKEMLRDELLAYLLFGNYHDSKGPAESNSTQLHELSNYERELIKKLADQTEALFRAEQDDLEDND